MYWLDLKKYLDSCDTYYLDKVLENEFIPVNLEIYFVYYCMLERNMCFHTFRLNEWLLSCRSPRSIRYLVQWGADIQVKNNYLIRHVRDVNHLQLLLELGADPTTLGVVSRICSFSDENQAIACLKLLDKYTLNFSELGDAPSRLAKEKNHLKLWNLLKIKKI